MDEECPNLIDDIDACFWCSNCRMRHEDCMCVFDDDAEEDYIHDG